MFKVVKSFVTVSRRFHVGQFVVPDDCDSRGQWSGLRDNGFIEEIKAEAPAVTPANDDPPRAA